MRLFILVLLAVTIWEKSFAGGIPHEHCWTDAQGVEHCHIGSCTNPHGGCTMHPAYGLKNSTLQPQARVLFSKSSANIGQVKLRMYLNVIEGMNIKEKLVCQTQTTYLINDLRQQSEQNGRLQVLFKNCQVNLFGTSFGIDAFLGAGIYQHNWEKPFYDIRTTSVSVQISGRRHQFWVKKPDANNQNSEVVMDLPIPPEVNMGSARGWIRVVAELKEI